MRIHNRTGYSLVELLTVIGIIGVLSALIFPTYAVIKDNAKKGACMTNLHAISSAIKLYYNDEKAYPEHLLYSEGPGQPMTGLYPKYIREQAKFTCQDSKAFTPGTDWKQAIPVQSMQPDGSTAMAYIYPMSTYDGGYIGGGAPANFEVHYAINRGIPNTAGPDFNRQLMFSDAPSNTVVTWCTYHRQMPTYAPASNREDLVLWLDGRAEKRTSADKAVQGTVN